MNDTPEQRLIAALRDRGLTMATAESCTGGMLSARLTSVSGSSAVFRGGVVSYCNEVKHALLNVPQAMLEKFGAVSDCVAEAMARGACAAAGAALGVGITGIAGPNSDESGKPVGLVYIGVCDCDGCRAEEFHFSGDRDAVRHQACDAAIKLLLQRLGEPA